MESLIFQIGHQLQLTEEQIVEYVTSRDSIEYFAETYVTLFGKTDPIRLNDFQQQVVSDCEKYSVFSRISERGEGKNTVASIILLHTAIFTENKYIGVFGAGFRETTYIIRDIAEMYDSLPDFLKFSSSPKFLSTSLSFPNNSRIECYGDNFEWARGKTLNVVFVNDSESIANIGDATAVLGPITHGKMFALSSSKTTSIFRKR